MSTQADDYSADIVRQVNEQVPDAGWRLVFVADPLDDPWVWLGCCVGFLLGLIGSAAGWWPL